MHECTEPWHLASFIPELRFRDREVSIKAWQDCRSLPRVVILNYYDLKKTACLERPAKVRELVGEDAAMILNCVAEDEELDRFSVNDYFEAALKLGAKALVTPDDYIYRIDYRFPTFQAHHFRRALERSEALLTLAENRLHVIGLVVGINKDQISLFVDRLKERGVHDFACACGDMLKRAGRREGIAGIGAFVKYCANEWKLLLGVESRNVILRLRPNAFSSSEWSFYACHNRVYRSGRKVETTDNDPRGWRLALHNLNENYRLKW